MDIADTKRRFFVRVEATKKQDVLAAFGSVEEISAGISEEFAFVTDVMTEKTFNEKISAIGGMINRIRIEG